MRRVFWSLCIGVTLFAKPQATVTQLFNVKTITVKSDNVGESHKYYGFTKVMDGNMAHQTVRVDGFVERIYVDENFQNVKKGEKLFDIYSPELVLLQNELLTALSTHTNEEQAESKLRLLEVDQRIIDEIKATRKIKEVIPVFSKFSGVVTEKTIGKGSTIKKGAMLYSLVDFCQMWAIAKVPQEDIWSITRGAKAVVTIDGNPNEFVSRVDKIYPHVNKEDKTVDVRVSLPNKNGKIFHNMFAKVSIFGTSQKRLILPKSAVLVKGGKTYVFKKGESEGEFEPLVVKGKKLTNGDFEILSGLNHGDEVVDKALFMLDSDAQINGAY